MAATLGLGIVGLTVFVLFLLPLAIVLFSPRSRGATKFGWLIVTLVFSWLGLAAFFIVTTRGAETAPR